MLRATTIRRLFRAAYLQPPALTRQSSAAAPNLILENNDEELVTTQPVPKPPTASPLTDVSSRHHSMTSFLAHATATSLSKASTVYIGTLYEYTVLASLRRLGFTLTRTGGRSDRGIDLRGHWTIPSLARNSTKAGENPSNPLETLKANNSIPVLLQCKALRRTSSPSTIRELEGAFAGAPTGWRNENTVAILVSMKPATKGVREAVGRSGLPLAFCMVDGEGVVRQLIWNRWVSQKMGEQFGVGLRYTVRGEETSEEIVLTDKGRVIQDVREGGEG
ncbi:MAG: hypothetical protein M1824_000078 [Vezdaea acicularis]|nr:MAG: hypothetical protein M1824_000078 [Vezdaea acicularis]